MNAHTNIVADTSKTISDVELFDLENFHHLKNCFRASQYESTNGNTLDAIRRILQPLLKVSVSEFHAAALKTAKELNDCLNANHEDGYYFAVEDAISETDTLQDVAAQIMNWAYDSHAIDSDDGDHYWQEFMREANAAACVMDPKLKAKWIDALKVEYADKKTVGALKDNDCYCCLGVLAELNGDLVEKRDDYWVTKGRDHSGWLPTDAYGLSDIVQHDLAGINDENDTFAPVIDYIERNL